MFYTREICIFVTIKKIGRRKGYEERKKLGKKDQINEKGEKIKNQMASKKVIGR